MPDKTNLDEILEKLAQLGVDPFANYIDTTPAKPAFIEYTVQHFENLIRCYCQEFCRQLPLEHRHTERFRSSLIAYLKSLVQGRVIAKYELTAILGGLRIDYQLTSADFPYTMQISTFPNPEVL